MKIHRLKAIGFRNYQELDYSPALGFNLLVGDNGAGKTNFLDMIHYLSTTKSYFTGLDRDVVRTDSDIMRVETWLSEEKTEHLVIKWSREKGKAVEWNGVPVEKVSQHLGRIKTVMMAPQDSFVLQLGNTERRRWLDRFLCQRSPEYALALSEYMAVLQRRNAYLKQTAMHKIEDGLLTQYWERMGPPAQVIRSLRAKSLLELSSHLQKYYHLISEGKEAVDMHYETNFQGDNWSENQDIVADIKQQTTKVGIHKDRIHFMIDNRKLKQYASQGQTKSFFLSLKLSEYQFLLEGGQAAPLLLIDDVYARLDEGRMQQFFNILKDMGEIQVFVTDTHEGRMRELLESMDIQGRVISVQSGKLVDVYETQK